MISFPSQSSRNRRNVSLTIHDSVPFRIGILVMLLLRSNHAFSVNLQLKHNNMNHHHSLHSNPITLHATTRRTSGDFEYQELTIQLQAMKDQEVNSSQLTATKRDELEGYIQKLLETQQQQSSSSTRPSSSHSASSILLFPLTRLADVLPKTKWRLVYTTEPLLNNKALPMKDVTIRLHFLDDSAVDYMLEFSNQPLGLQKLTAKSSYTVDVRKKINVYMHTFRHCCIVLGNGDSSRQYQILILRV